MHRMVAFVVIVQLFIMGNALAQGAPKLQGLRKPPEKLRILMTVDGSEKIYVQGNALWIVHDKAEFPSAIKIGTRKWEPQWRENTSDRYEKVDPAFAPDASSTVTVRKTKGRGGVYLTQQPSETNDFTACIQVDDPPNAADQYEFTLSWTK